MNLIPLSPGQFTVISTMVYQLIWPLNSISSTITSINNNLTRVNTLVEFLNTEVEIDDKDGAASLQHRDGRVEFRDVSFEYTPGTVALDRISFTVRGGASLGLVGHSGSGNF